MNITSTQIKKIFEIEEDNNIPANRLLILTLSISVNKAPVLKEIQKKLEMTSDETLALLELLEQENLLSKSDYSLINRLEKTKIINRESFDIAIEQIIDHLNAITGSKRKVTDSRKKYILQWLRKGYSIESFIKVNLYFYYEWHANPAMEKYIQPETLYNSKFESRVEIADKEFSKIEKYREEIKRVCETYQDVFKKLIVEPSLKYQTEVRFLENVDKNLCKFIPFEIQQKIAFWIKKGYQAEEIVFTIYKTIEQWSKKEELYPHINLKRILDDRFPERIEVAKRTVKSINESLVDWVNN